MYIDKLQKIGFVLGKVLCIDDDIVNHYTKVVEIFCVEVNMNNPLKEVIHI